MDLETLKNLIDFDDSIVKQLEDKNDEKKFMSQQIENEKVAYRENSWKAVEEKLTAKRNASKEKIEKDSQLIKDAFKQRQKYLDDTFTANKQQWIDSITKNIFE